MDDLSGRKALSPAAVQLQPHPPTHLCHQLTASGPSLSKREQDERVHEHEDLDDQDHTVGSSRGT
jgi:hypothetical protein